MSGRTVYVIGAGASSELNLPTGEALKSQISELLDIRYRFSDLSHGDERIASTLEASARDERFEGVGINRLQKEAWYIRDTLPLSISIDNLIDLNRGNEPLIFCAKVAIVRAILAAEKNSKLYFDRNNRNESFDYGVLTNTWYVSFIQQLTENCDLSELKIRLCSVSLIIFNYDRCIEHFLVQALSRIYKLSENDAYELVSEMNIYHPYGAVGDLTITASGSGIAFGGEPSPQSLAKLAEGIRTFTEGADANKSNVKAIATDMGSAEKLIFLGFAFHKLNMKLLKPDLSGVSRDHKPSMYGTTYGLSEHDASQIKLQVGSLYRRAHHLSSDYTVNTSNLSCAEFFQHYWRSLAF